MTEQVRAIGFFEAIRPDAEDDEFTADAVCGICDYSHIEVLYLFHEVEPSKIITGPRHPRNNPDFPAVGIFAQRGKNRPNRIGSTVFQLLRIEGVKLSGRELDAILGVCDLHISDWGARPVSTAACACSGVLAACDDVCDAVRVDWSLQCFAALRSGSNWDGYGLQWPFYRSKIVLRL